MLNGIIDFSLRHRILVILGAVVFAIVGGLSLRQLDIDAFPDTTPVQVQINMVAPALGPEEIEQQITFPIEQVVSGLPKLTPCQPSTTCGPLVPRPSRNLPAVR